MESDIFTGSWDWDVDIFGFFVLEGHFSSYQTHEQTNWFFNSLTGFRLSVKITGQALCHQVSGMQGISENATYLWEQKGMGRMGKQQVSQAQCYK